MRYWSEDPSVYRVGAHGGKGFSTALSDDDAIEYLLGQAERADEKLKDNASGAPLGPDQRVVDFFIYRLEQGYRLSSVLPRVQAAWFRAVARAHTQHDSLKRILLEQAKEHAQQLEIEPQRAAKALRGS
jgi:hypothetical protein